MERPQVVVVVLTFNTARYVDACFGALARARLAGSRAEVLAVDNASTDGTAAQIRARYPWVSVIENPQNLGFAGGNNVGMRAAIDRGADWIYLLNPDTEVEAGFLEHALAVARETPNAGSVQSLLLLPGERPLINTAGNRIHFLGFGYCGLLGAPIEAAPPAPVEIPFASGAAVLLSVPALREIGLFDEFLFLYQEDMDLGWRLRLSGFVNFLAPASVVLHHYEFSRNVRKYFFLERNRLIVLFKNLAPRSLLVLAPLLVAAELGLLAVSIGAGWLPEKLRAWAQFGRRETWRHIRSARKAVQATRRVSDWKISEHFTHTVDFPGLPGGSLATLLSWPMRASWWLLRPLMSRRTTKPLREAP
ncbi:MAG: glycosyltransferase family 2 protein [Anaeromyxobacteraceae bacterium]